ncbi:L-threonine O-3-phosphate decarboxylase [Enterovirga rhinocerotis]|uniref:8-amino-7-oxononanoate synthase n=2 Tax=Enterovirga rhinocerotis TaxID=1339210 RepID=A0A4R7CAY2_9HYPH|nr:threonine-phosphate decarboxylase CobD [Enterovirga rhinocerotis]TDR94565.1 L-threonine O-3-phosphate decarboxylase [Enterovirga rhinocerotis]
MKHGGDLFEAKARHGEGDPAWLDLSTGLNPHPWPVPAALRHAGWERLPGSAAMRALLDAAREAYRVPEGAEIVAAPGTQALIQWLPRLAPPGAVSVLGLTYAEHAASWRAAGRDVIPAPDPSPPGEGESAPADRGGVLPGRGCPHPGSLPEQVRERLDPPLQGGIGGASPTHRVVVNPNNPDGRILGLAALAAMAEDCARAGGWLVVDEAYADLDPAMTAASLVPDLPVIVLRSFGKFYGLAGLRLGFAVAQPAVAERLRAALGDWAVSGPALAVGAAALADEDWAAAMRVRLAQEAAGLDAVLGEAGLSPGGGTGLYRLVRHPEAADLHERLAAAHVWCRRFDWAPDLLRFGLPPDEAGFARLREALREAAHAQGTSTASSRNRSR